ncbi:MAG: hypothetical protein FWF50_06445 [Defluviitaleaceae bacterium]|nr:hypothetical protein [Defluviitaleaceae bacterium]
MTYKDMYLQLLNNQERGLAVIKNAHLEAETLFIELENDEYAMEAYEEAYYKLFNAATDTIESFKNEQLKSENSYINTTEDSIFAIA